MSKNYEVAIIIKHPDIPRSVGTKLDIPLDSAPEDSAKLLVEAFETLKQTTHKNQFFSEDDVRRELGFFVELVPKLNAASLPPVVEALRRVFGNLDPSVSAEARQQLAKDVEAALHGAVTNE